MDTYRVIITEKAEADMENIYDYIAIESMSVEPAKKQYNQIANQILSLAEMPARVHIMESEPEHTLQVRKMPVGEYYILFQVRGRQVIVLRVLHCRQDIEGKIFE